MAGSPRFGGPFGKLLLPAIILQSVLIGGGYATGREIVEYGGRFGPRGWIAVLTIFAGFTLMAFVTFEVARVFRAYSYKRFIRQVIGPLWPLFDLLFVAMAVLIIAVMASAAGSILQVTVGLPEVVGSLLIVVSVGALTFFGARVIELFKSVGTGLLYGAYLLFAVLVLSRRWDEMTDVLLAGESLYLPEASAGTVLLSGVLYVGYNLAIFPAVLFCLWRQDSPRETAASSLLAGGLMTVPFALTFLCILSFYPSAEVLEAPVPWLPMLQGVGGGAVLVVFGVVMGWTLLETSVGLIHAIIDRIDADLEGGLGRLRSGLLGVGILLAAMLLSRVGIIALVARGYAIMGYLFIALFALPLLTVGTLRILRARNGASKRVAAGPRPEPWTGSEPDTGSEQTTRAEPDTRPEPGAGRRGG